MNQIGKVVFCNNNFHVEKSLLPTFLKILFYIQSLTTFYRAPQNSSLDDSEDSIECWTTHRIYKKHVEDVSDLSWSADSSKIASCGIDHSVFIWDVEQPGKEPIARLDLHTHYIQGIAFDPFGQIVVSLSADRTMRVYQAMKKSKKSKTKEWRQKYKVHAIQPAGYERQVNSSFGSQV